MVILIFLLELSTEPDEFSIKIRETICVVKVGVLVIVASMVATKHTAGRSFPRTKTR
jgi:hypothetical protein